MYQLEQAKALERVQLNVNAMSALRVSYDMQRASSMVARSSNPYERFQALRSGSTATLQRNPLWGQYTYVRHIILFILHLYPGKHVFSNSYTLMTLFKNEKHLSS